MRQIIFILTVSLFMISCGQNDTKQKELELKEREIAIKEKELALASNDSIKSSLIKPSIQTPIKINKLELPFTGEKHFGFDASSVYTLSISKDGIVTIRREVSSSYQEALGATDNDLIEFKGPFKTIIKIKDGYRYKIEADKISIVDANGNIEKFCGNLGDEICSTTYY